MSRLLLQTFIRLSSWVSFSIFLTFTSKSEARIANLLSSARCVAWASAQLVVKLHSHMLIVFFSLLICGHLHVARVLSWHTPYYLTLFMIVFNIKSVDHKSHGATNLLKMVSNLCGVSVPLSRQSTGLLKIEADSKFVILQATQLDSFFHCSLDDCAKSDVAPAERNLVWSSMCRASFCSNSTLFVQ